MNISKETILKKLKNFEDETTQTQIPEWSALPDIELYMDQVIVLLNQYLKGVVSAQITQSMINNYVKQKAVPAPVKKRYSKIHLCYLIIFCTLKQSLSIATIQKIIPVDLNEDEVEKIYSSFLKNRQKSAEYTIKHTKEISETLESEEDTVYSANMVMRLSALSGTFKSITESILNESSEHSNE